MQKTFEHSAQADLVLLVLEAHQPLSADDFHIFNKIGSKPVVLVLNKMDLLNGGSMPAVIPEEWGTSPRVLVSALTGQGIEKLQEKVLDLARGDGRLEPAAAIIPTCDRKSCSSAALNQLKAAAACLENRDASELVDIHVRDVLDGMDEILGIGVKTDILESISADSASANKKRSADYPVAFGFFTH